MSTCLQQDLVFCNMIKCIQTFKAKPGRYGSAACRAGRDITPVRAPMVTGLVPYKRSSDEAGAARRQPGTSAACFLVTGAEPLRLRQDLTGSAALADVALLLWHRDHEPSCTVSDDG